MLDKTQEKKKGFKRTFKSVKTNCLRDTETLAYHRTPCCSRVSSAPSRGGHNDSITLDLKNVSFMISLLKIKYDGRYINQSNFQKENSPLLWVDHVHNIQFWKGMDWSLDQQQLH